MTSPYRSRVAALAVMTAREDPPLVKEVITRLRQSGEIASDDLVYLDRSADRWIRIAEQNRSRTGRGPGRLMFAKT